MKKVNYDHVTINIIQVWRLQCNGLITPTETVERIGVIDRAERGTLWSHVYFPEGIDLIFQQTTWICITKGVVCIDYKDSGLFSEQSMGRQIVLEISLFSLFSNIILLCFLSVDGKKTYGSVCCWKVQIKGYQICRKRIGSRSLSRRIISYSTEVLKNVEKYSNILVNSVTSNIVNYRNSRLSY